MIAFILSILTILALFSAVVEATAINISSTPTKTLVPRKGSKVTIPSVGVSTWPLTVYQETEVQCILGHQVKMHGWAGHTPHSFDDMNGGENHLIQFNTNNNHFCSITANDPPTEDVTIPLLSYPPEWDPWKSPDGTISFACEPAGSPSANPC